MLFNSQNPHKMPYGLYVRDNRANIEMIMVQMIAMECI